MVLESLTGLLSFSWDDLMALDLPQPASWLMVGVIAICGKIGLDLGRSLYPCFEKLDDKLIELLGGEE